MKKFLIVLSSLLIVICVVLGIKYSSLKSEKEWVQNNIDTIFTTNFSQLNSDLMTIALNPNLTDEELGYYLENTTKSGNQLSSLVHSTSYRDNKTLCDMVNLLDQASGSDALYSIEMSEDINRNLTELLVGRFENTELCKKTYDLIKGSVEKM